MFALTKSLPQRGKGDRLRWMRCPHPCPHDPSAAHKQTVYRKPCRDRASGQQVASLSASLFARTFGGEGCSHLQKAFLREEGGTSYASDGRSLRNFKICAILTVAHSPSVAVGASSLSEGALQRKFAAVEVVFYRLFVTDSRGHLFLQIIGEGRSPK